MSLPAKYDPRVTRNVPPDGPVIENTYAVNLGHSGLGSSSLSVTAFDWKIASDTGPQIIQKVALVAALLHGGGAKTMLTAKTPLTLDGNEGLEVAAKGEKYQGRDRVYVVGRRVYVVTVSGPIGEPLWPGTDRFFATFRFVKILNETPAYNGTWYKAYYTVTGQCLFRWPTFFDHFFDPTSRPINLVDPTYRIEFRWHGQCENGKLSGNGVLTVSINNRESMYYRFSNETGVTWQRGEIRVTYNLNDINMKAGDCKDSIGGGVQRGAIAYIPNNWDIGNGFALDPIFLRLRSFVADRCPSQRPDDDNTSLGIDYAKFINTNEYGHNNLAWCGFKGVTNGDLRCQMGWSDRPVVAKNWYAVHDELTARDRAVQEEAERRRAEVTTQEQNRIAMAERAKRIAVQRAFASKFGVQKFSTLGQLIANPFLFRNQIVGVNLSFVRMISEDEALFASFGVNQIVVRNVPTTRFRGNESIVLAVRMIGTKRMGGGVTLPFGSYIGFYECKSPDCSDFYVAEH
jgi:hypothetical protein